VSADAPLAIGEVARRLGISTRTLRYYQELGLVAPSGSSPGGNRRYHELDVARVQHIRELQDVMGLDLERIGTVVRAEDRLAALRAEVNSAPPSPERMAEILREAMAINHELRAQVADRERALRDFLADLDAKEARYRRLAAELEVDLDPAPASEPERSGRVRSGGAGPGR
jgi:MerR family transcriptional regulator, repressor of the yfmOP operon